MLSREETEVRIKELLQRVSKLEENFKNLNVSKEIPINKTVEKPKSTKKSKK